MVKLRRLLGLYKLSNEYWIPVKDIIIPDEYKDTPPRASKYAAKEKYYFETGEYESPIFITRDFLLTDGYTSYLIAKNCGEDKVPVHFVN